MTTEIAIPLGMIVFSVVAIIVLTFWDGKPQLRPPHTPTPHTEYECMECHRLGCLDCGHPIVHKLDCSRDFTRLVASDGD